MLPTRALARARGREWGGRGAGAGGRHPGLREKPGKQRGRCRGWGPDSRHSHSGERAAVGLAGGASKGPTPQGAAGRGWWAPVGWAQGQLAAPTPQRIDSFPAPRTWH